MGPLSWAQLGHTALPALGGSDGHRAGQGPVGVGRTAQDLGRVGSGVGGGGSHLAGLPTPLTPSPSHRGASRPPTATYPTPGPAPATTTWQLWPPRPSWVSSGCLLLPREPAQCPIATGGGKVRAELQLEGLQPCWMHKFLKARLHAGILQGLGVPAPLGFSCWVLLKF